VRFPVFIELRRSLCRAGALCVMHGAAAGVFSVLPWPLPLRIASFAVLAASLRHSLRPPRVASLRLHENGGLECVLPDGTDLPAAPLPDSTVFPWLVVLRLKADGRKRVISLPLFQDHMSREEFRLLRLWLRWRPGERRQETEDRRQKILRARSAR
jgi:hypothetical protein